jgi:HPt (histidine-containing phosphotransfer) domain-containing protein
MHSKPDASPSAATGGMDSPEKGVPVYDRAGFLIRIMGDGELARQVEDTFIEDIPVQLDRLEQAVAGGDWFMAENQVHQVKGAAATLGAEAFRVVAARVEKIARSGVREEIPRLLPGLRKRFDEVAEEIRRLRDDE